MGGEKPTQLVTLGYIYLAHLIGDHLIPEQPL